MAGGIRRRLILSFVLFAVALGTALGGLAVLVFHRVEDTTIERSLRQRLDRGTDHPDGEADYVGPLADAPAAFARRLQDATPGHHEWNVLGREMHALVLGRDGENGPMVAITSFPEAVLSETLPLLALVLGVATTAILALVLARVLALRIVSPIEHLTARMADGVLDGIVDDTLQQDLRDDEIGLLAHTLDRAGRSVAASAERERRFLREASHELRTPITVIQGVSDLLRESIDPQDDLTRRRLDRLGRSLRRMNTSVASLLAMARAEHRQSTATLPPFAQQLDDLVEETRALARPGVHVRSTLAARPASHVADSMLIVVLSNLARNAAQHTESGFVEVRVDRHRVQVADSGPGLSASVQEQVRGTTPRPGIGIGLATVLRICERFDWRLSVDCPPEGGTTVTVAIVQTLATQRPAPPVAGGR